MDRYAKSIVNTNPANANQTHQICTPHDANSVWAMSAVLV